MKEFKILMINLLWPYPKHNQAANVILFELITELAKQAGVKISFLKMNKFEEQKMPSKEQEEGIRAMKSLGIDVLPPLNMPAFNKRRAKWLRGLFPKFDDFYPGIKNMGQIKDAIMVYDADVLFIPLSEWATALCCDIPIIKFAYYSNPDPKQAFAMTKFNWRTGQSNFSRWIAQKIAYRKLEKIHLNIMRKYELLGNLAANDAQYYVSHGHPNSFYIQNVWIDRFPNWREERNKLEQAVSPVIVGNVGRLSATANTHGLDLLGKEYLPALRAVMNGKPYEVHLFGSDKPHPAVASALRKPEVHLRGFVDDIDREIFRAQVFLCLNNASAYKVGHTRYLHAWSLGCCVVAHRDASLSMPEIVHGKNALLGDSVEEIAKLTKQAINDPVLRSKLGAAGYETFKQYFTAEKVVPKIMAAINNYMQKHVR